IRLTLSEANYLAFGDRFGGKSRCQFAQIVMIEKSGHAPGAYNVSEFTSRSSPGEWLAASAQPPINQFTLRTETNPAITLLFHDREYKLATAGAQTFQSSH